MTKQTPNIVSFKNLTYALLGIIFFLLILLGFSYFNVQKKHKDKETGIDKLISTFENKFYNDSINLVKQNNSYLNKIRQNVIDSVVLVYEEKLKIAFKNNKLEALSASDYPIQEEDFVHIALNANTNTKPKKKHSEFSSNVTTYSKLENYKPKPNYSESKKYASNVTTYTKLRGYKNKEIKTKATKNTSNVTTYSKLNNTNLTTRKNTTNVTSYSKLGNAYRASIVPKKINNVTTYSKLKNNSYRNNTQKTALNKSTRDTKNESSISKQNSNLVYTNVALNNAINFNDVEVSPIYPGCENKYTESNKKNCFATKLSGYVVQNLNSKNFNKSNLKKGYNDVRVLLVVDNQGNSRLEKIVGHWPQNVKIEINRVINSIPKMTPGKQNNKNTSVKYSFKIPFLVK